MTAVVHTIGTLFEKSGYKSALKDGNVPRFVSSVAAGIAGSEPSANPLEREEKKREGSYEVVNRDSGASLVVFSYVVLAHCCATAPSRLHVRPVAIVIVHCDVQRCACARRS